MSRFEAVPGTANAAPPDDEAPRPGFNLASELSECAIEDRAPDAAARLLFGQQGFIYLGPEKDGFAVQVSLPGGLLAADQMLGLASMCQQFANGGVEFDEGGQASLQVVSVCDAPEALRQIEVLGLKTAAPAVKSPVTRKRLLSGEMVSLAERMVADGSRYGPFTD